ncbi:CDP-diacylglycerol--serine O-phosphatidyltransferase [Clostridium fermenticellae]|uniref:CDP-diacylglycerol--serine O-phosphatidyltransferase n=1 Tax=Clostridium fermenticellae TaxID=2068654 RepID=A0A386H673_9CLOT|nr:CDP-diacylglycerol--serine O-phosphatidyltransferase [Clostridium fermenticellae]AYD41247.1 CDP-diacylglycerol--serine O-phosphatidyltransferase [Clostridium fermenticellae]
MVKMEKSAVPNIFTFTNLGCGVLSLMMTFQENFKLAAVFIILACLADRYDGRVARFLKVASPIGKELDSLADLVSFGVAPSILAFNIFSFSNLGLVGYLIALLLPISGAYRLARFNVTEFDGQFFGIPITFAGMFMAIYCLISAFYPTMNYAVPSGIGIITVLIMLILSYLMVSKHRFKKF